MALDGSLERLRREGRIVVVGASLAGLRAAETLREEGFTGTLTMIGDEPYEPYEPYDRPPLSKQVLLGLVPVDQTVLPHRRALDARWRLGVAATALDVAAKRVALADGTSVEYDRLLIATGVRSRPWPNELAAGLDGVFVLRTTDDAARLVNRLRAGPRRVLVIGAGFTGSEIASVCRERELPVTVAERGPAPLAGALGGVIGEVAADLRFMVLGGGTSYEVHAERVQNREDHHGQHEPHDPSATAVLLPLVVTDSPGDSPLDPSLFVAIHVYLPHLLAPGLPEGRPTTHLRRPAQQHAPLSNAVHSAAPRRPSRQAPDRDRSGACRSAGVLDLSPSRTPPA